MSSPSEPDKREPLPLKPVPPALREGADAPDLKVLADVEEIGCSIMGVMPDANTPTFTYSTGLFHNFGHPEVLICGLPARLCQTIINTMMTFIRYGGVRFEAGTSSDRLISNFDCRFRVVDPSRYVDLLGYSRRFYRGNDFPAVQCCWPDQKGRFPWEPEFDPKYLPVQPTYEQSI